MRLSGRGLVERIANVWQRLAGSLWFVPGVMVLLAAALAVALVDVSTHVDPEVLQVFPRLFGATPESSSRLLSTVAGAIITVAGVTFSILVVAVSQASAQYSPRVLRNFMRDRLSQVTLGFLVGVFVYCLAVLRTIRSEEGDKFVPALAVLGALLLAVAAVALLVYFIHHIASTLEVGSIVERVTAQTLAAIDRQFPEELAESDAQSESAPSPEVVPQGEQRWWPVRAVSSGYIQHIELDALSESASQLCCVVRLERRPGDFVADTTTLLHVLDTAPPRDSVAGDLLGFFVIESYRTVYQDVAFGIRQIVDIANKALSPGINDPTTAVTCIEYLSVILARIASRQLGDRTRELGGRMCVIVPAHSFEEFLDDAFSELRRSGSTQPRVLASILRALELAAQGTHSTKRRKLVLDQVRLVRASIEALPGAAADRERSLRLCNGIEAWLQSHDADRVSWAPAGRLADGCSRPRPSPK
jgi:uncharacterized membrane protein